MKITKISLIIFFSFTILYSQEGWFYQHPFPQGNNLNDVFVIDNNHMIAVGSNSTILSSGDCGKTWEIKYYAEQNIELTSIHFINSDTGWICSSNGIVLKTMNGGKTWCKIKVLDNINLYKIYFWNGLEGWAAGYSYLLDSYCFLKTVDGGKNWSKKYIHKISGWQNASYFINPDLGWISCGKTLFKTTNGGASWDSVAGDIFNSIYFLDENIGWAVSVGCWTECSFLCFKTSDGGLTWEELYSNSGKAESVFFENYNKGWIVGEINFKTTDGGTTWDTCFSSLYSNSKAIGFNEKGSIGYIVGSFGSVFQTTDFGVSWQVKSNLTANHNLNSIFFVDHNNGWAVGGKEILVGGDFIEKVGIVLNTVNGGSDWVEYKMHTETTFSELFNDIFFVDENVGWIVGEIYPHGIYKTTDGKKWDFVNLPGGYDSVNNYNSVYFINQDTGWMAGSTGWKFERTKNFEGIIKKTTDGGYSWNEYKIETENSALNDILFLNTQKGFAAGDKGIVIASEDGGKSWVNLQLAESNISFTCIYFDKNNGGWIAGYKEDTPKPEVMIYRTTDEGLSWSSSVVEGVDIYKIHSIWFNGNGVGFAVGTLPDDRGAILFSMDGGISWNLDSSINPSGLNSIYFLNDDLGWIAGTGGVILKTTTGGITSVKDISFNLENSSKGYNLSQNYPNPFNPTTSIKYSTTSRQIVTLEIFNVLGQKIQTLVNEEKPAGNYQVEFSAKGGSAYGGNAADLPSGVYFYRIRAGSFLETRKMIFMK